MLELAPPNAEVLYWLAFVQDALGDPGARRRPAGGRRGVARRVFPFRPESAEVFAWAASKTANWRPRYYLALVQWSAGNLDEARRLFAECGETPDFAPFYAARAQAVEATSREKALADLEQAARLDPAQWRYGRMLADRQLRQGDPVAALATARRYSAQFPEQLHPRHAARQDAARQPALRGRRAQCSAASNVLPYEGSTEGRRLYREAQLMLAVQALKKGDPAVARREVDAARALAREPGAGKPYPADVDETARGLAGRAGPRARRQGRRVDRAPSGSWPSPAGSAARSRSSARWP